MHPPIKNICLTHCTGKSLSRQQLISWVNRILQSNIEKVEDLCSGAAYCQLLHILFPEALSMKRIKFSFDRDYEYTHNIKLLQKVFTKLGITKTVSADNIIKARFSENYDLLKWFKRFFDANYNGRQFDPVDDRYGYDFQLTSKLGNKKVKKPIARRVSKTAPNYVQHKGHDNSNSKEIAKSNRTTIETLLYSRESANEKIDTIKSEEELNNILMEDVNIEEKINEELHTEQLPTYRGISETFDTRLTTTNKRSPYSAVDDTPQYHLPRFDSSEKSDVNHNLLYKTIREQRNFYYSILRKIEVICLTSQQQEPETKELVNNIMEVLCEVKARSESPKYIVSCEKYIFVVYVSGGMNKSDDEPTDALMLPP